MPCYLVSYDLIKNKDYSTISKEMKALGAHKALESVYLVNTHFISALLFRKHLENFIDSDDKMIVVPFDERPATIRTKHGTKEWLDDIF